MIFAPALTERSVIKDLKGTNITQTKKPCLTTVEPQHQPDTVPEWRLKNTRPATLHAQGIVCSHVMVPFVLLWSTQLVSQTKRHSLKRRSHNSTKYHVLCIYIYIMNVKRLTCRLECCLRNCNRSHLLVNALTCFHCHVHYCVHSKTKTAYIYIYIYIGNSISTSLQSSRLIMLTYAPPSWPRQRLLQTQKP